MNAFPFSLTGSTSKWYYNLDMGKVKGWTELVNAFLTQFPFDTMIDITLGDLETTKQREGETFSEYLVNWREKASKMINHPGEKDQVNIMMKDLLPIYFNRMLSTSIMNFEQLCDCGIRIEDAMENEGRATIKKAYGQASNKTTSQPNVSAIYQAPTPSTYPYQYSNPPKQIPTPKPRRHFDPLEAPFSKVYDYLLQRGHLKPLDPTPMPNLIPKNLNLNLYCHFHQKSNHSMDKCVRLKNKIQDLIDKDVIPKPNPPTLPNIHQNTLPNYQRIPPLTEMNYVEDEEFVLAIDDEAWVDFYESGNGDLCHSTRIGKHFKPPHLEVDHPGREDLEREVPNVKDVEKIGKGKNIAKTNEVEDRVLTQLKMT